VQDIIQLDSTRDKWFKTQEMFDQLYAAHRSTVGTYISGTGTAGIDNTAMTVYSSIFPANVLSQVGDRMRIRTYFNSDAGGSIVAGTWIGASATSPLVGVNVAHTTHAGGAALGLTECWLHYIDSTHGNIIENEEGALGMLSAANVAGFAWNQQQTIRFTQSAVSAKHLTLYAQIVDVLPKGTST
jgi:hypothetical protein